MSAGGLVLPTRQAASSSGRSRAARFLAFPLTRLVLAAVVVVLPVVLTMDLVHLALAKSMRVVWPPLLASALCVSAYRVYVLRVEKRALSELGRPRAGRELGTGLLVGSLLLVATVGTVAALGRYAISGRSDWTTLLTPLAPLILVVVLEEVLFRGVLFRIVEQSLGSWIALSLSGVLFGLAHLSNAAVTVLAVGNTAATWVPASNRVGLLPMFAGFTSRCTSPAACASWRAPQTCSRMKTTRPAGSAPAYATRSSRSPPSRCSIA
jgi:membrane protease YdiL (CAAX protease family)